MIGLEAFVQSAAALSREPTLDDTTGPLLHWLV
jgi:hypothetical protein